MKLSLLLAVTIFLCLVCLCWCKRQKSYAGNEAHQRSGSVHSHGKKRYRRRTTSSGESGNKINPLHKRKFEGSEHRDAANVGTITLAGGAVHPVSEVMFKNAHGVNLYNFGNIVATSGDYYGALTIAKSVCSGTTDAQKRINFQAIFDMMWQEKSQKTVDKIKNLFDTEMDKLAHRKPGSATSQVFVDLGEARFVGVGPGFLSISLSNLDHFGGCAHEAYRIGHTIAQETARKAGKEKDPQVAAAMLLQAYAEDASACHFVSDMFSTGHIRTPRKELLSVCHSWITGDENPGLLAQWQHGEDNKNGLTVKNNKGQVWKAFGDGNLFEPASLIHYRIVAQTIQLSRDEIYAASLGGADQFGAFDLIPSSWVAQDSTCPLFSTDSHGAVLMRKPWEQLYTPGCPTEPFQEVACTSAIWQKLKSFVHAGSIELKQSADGKGWVIPDPRPKKKKDRKKYK